MSRVIEPLREIGARVDGRDRGNLAPIVIRGGTLKPFRYNSPTQLSTGKICTNFSIS